MSQIQLNKFEKEKRGIELYKKGKTIREIAEEVLISFRDISQIIKKFIEDTMKTKKYKRKYQFKIYLFLREKKAYGGCNIFRALIDVLIFIKLF